MQITNLTQLKLLAPKTKIYIAKYRGAQVVESYIFIAEHPRYPGEAILNNTVAYNKFEVIEESKFIDNNMFISTDYRETCVQAIKFAERDLMSIKEIYGEWYHIIKNLPDYVGYSGERVRKVGYDFENELFLLVNDEGKNYGASEDELTKIDKY
jgi:hypothetical protein